MTAEEKREAVAAKYRVIIGRNQYSQSLRSYCFTKYKDGKYYSDCSSSVSYAYKQAGYGFGILNTVGMFQSTKLVDVPVSISKGQIQNPEVLRVGDMLLYAGSDSARAYAGYVGHVEMVGEIINGKYYLYGHGSGTPKRSEMTAKNKDRYNSKTSTKLGNKGLIKVVRFILDDDINEPAPDPVNGRKVRSGSWNIRTAPDTSSEVVGVAKGGSIAESVSADGWKFVKVGNMFGWISNKALED